MKKYVKEKNMSDFLPDFYHNIVLERHKNDIDGYDILYVNPLHKGNYASRLSHSCNPNCIMLTSISNGQYFIGLYAYKEILPGEELTYDYCCMTDFKIE